jgi:Co/Zn/Cd efflux system component|tara:strand:- start:4074 stop:4919 length:846 start_codon:yes stop_codon:yes gene_type:complete
MNKTSVKIKKMDCPSEIKMIEGLMEKLEPSAKMEFDLESRIVHFYHSVDKHQIMETLNAISLPGDLISSQEVFENDIPDISPSVEAKTLKYLLSINFTMFVVEIILGIYAESTGLLADGLDMLADSFVYGLSLYAVGKAIAMKHKAAYFSGIMQISLGLLCLVEVGRKFYFGSEPLSNYMIVVSIVALFANAWCLALIHKHKDGEVHMKASWIFSANDVIVNIGVIVSGLLVYFFKSNLPDLLIGGIVSLIVIRGGISIIKLSKIKKVVSIKDSCGSNKRD